LNDFVGIVKFLHGKNEKKKSLARSCSNSKIWSLEMASNLFFLAHTLAIVAAASTLVAIV
jgi:hypothetical protein